MCYIEITVILISVHEYTFYDFVLILWSNRNLSYMYSYAFLSLFTGTVQSNSDFPHQYVMTKCIPFPGRHT